MCVPQNCKTWEGVRQERREGERGDVMWYYGVYIKWCMRGEKAGEGGNEGLWKLRRDN